MFTAKIKIIKNALIVSIKLYQLIIAYLHRCKKCSILPLNCSQFECVQTKRKSECNLRQRDFKVKLTGRYLKSAVNAHALL